MARKKQKKADIDIERSEPAFLIVKEEISSGAKLHFHNYLETELVVGGSSWQVLNGQKIPIKRGSLYVLRPMLDCHMVEPNPISVYKFYVKAGEIAESLYNKLLLLTTPLYVELTEEETTNVTVVFEIMMREQETQGTYFRDMIKSYLESVIMLFLRKYGNNGENLLREKLLGYLLQDDKYLSDVTLTDMAQDFGYSSPHMSSLFSKAVGTSFTDEKILLRIQYATRLILTTDYNMGEIAKMSGFSRYTLFAKAFKKYMGVSAMQFKKQNSQG